MHFSSWHQIIGTEQPRMEARLEGRSEPPALINRPSCRSGNGRSRLQNNLDPSEGFSVRPTVVYVKKYL